MIVDLTAQFRAELSNYPQPANTHSLTTVSHSVRLYATYTHDAYQSLLKIRNILNDSRDNYFSNASYSYEAFSDRQRDQLNALIKQNLDEVSFQINKLDQEVKKFAFKTTTEKKYQEQVIMCLFQFYKKINAIFNEFLAFTLKRKKKIQSTVALDKQAEKGKYKAPKVQRPAAYTDESLEKQADILYVYKVKEQNELRETKKQIESMNELMANMSNLVLEQELQTSGFLQISETGLFHIQRGNKNLVQANILAKQTGRIYSLIFYCMAFSLLLFDFLKS